MHHRAGGNQTEHEKDRGSNGDRDRADVANLLGKTLDEPLFGCRFGFRARIGKHRIEGLPELRRAGRIRNLHHIPTDQALLWIGPILVKVIVAEKKLRLIESSVGVINAGDVELPGILRLVNRRPQGNPVANLPAVSGGNVLADDDALAVAQPLLNLGRIELYLFIDVEKGLGLDGHCRQDVRIVLIRAIEPVLMRHRFNAGSTFDLLLVGDRQGHDQCDLVDQHEPVDAGNFNSQAEGRSNRHHNSEKQEGDEDRKQSKRRANPAAPDVRPGQRQIPHWRPSPSSTPFSRCKVRCARSAACGSCVTMTMVLP